MKYEHKAIIDAAAREGKLPSEMAKELLAHDLLKAMVACVSGHAVAFSKMSQQQQDAAIHDMQRDLTSAIDTGVRVIASQATRTVRMKLKSVAIGKKWKIVGEAEGNEEYLHELADRTQDQSDVLVVLYERDYLQGLDAIQGEKDQKSLPIDEAPAADKPKAKRGGAKDAADIAAKVAPKKAIELPPKLVEDAEAFVRNIQTATHAGIQNQFKINFDKADAILVELEARGVVTAQDEAGNRQLVRVKAKPDDTVAPDDKPVEQIHTPDAGEAEDKPVDIYEKAKAKVIKDQEVSASGLAVAFDLTDEQAADIVDRMEMDGIISEESDLGTREVFEQP